MLEKIIFYVDLLITLTAYSDAYDLAITAVINGYSDPELSDQIEYLKELILS